LKGAAAKNETIERFRTAIRVHNQKYTSVKWIGVILHLAFGEAECFNQAGKWVRCDISTTLQALNAELRSILTLVNDEPTGLLS
jgi:hypothetical protein